MTRDVARAALSRASTAVKQSKVAQRLRDVDLDRPAFQWADTARQVGALVARNPSAAGLFRQLDGDAIRDLARLEDPVAQHRLIDDWKTRELSADEVQKAMDRYSSSAYRDDIAQFYARAGADGTKVAARLDQSDFDDLFESITRCSRPSLSGAAITALRPGDCSRQSRIDSWAVLTQLSDDVAPLVGDLDPATLSKFSDIGTDTIGGPLMRKQLAKAYDDGESFDIEGFVDTYDGLSDNGKELVREAMIENGKSPLTIKKAVFEKDIPVSELGSNIGDLQSFVRQGDATKFEFRRGRLDGSVSYYDDGDEFIRNAIREYERTHDESIFSDYPIDSIDEIDQLSKGEWYSLRGEIGEDVIAPRILEAKGYEVIEPPFDFSGSAEGIDLVAQDSNGNLVVVEVKTRSGSPSEVRPTGTDWLSDPDKGRQLSDDWLQSTIQDLRQQNPSPEQEEFLDMLEQSINSNNGVKKEFIAIHDRSPQGETVRPDMRSPRGFGDNEQIDNVDIAYLGRWFEQTSPIYE